MQEALQEADVLIDGVFGTGFSGDIEGTIGEILRFASTQRGYKLALDIPSGIEADTGYVGQNAFHADLTMTFDAPKIAHFIDHSAALCGKIRVADIGIPKAVQDQFPGEGEVLDVGYVQKHLRPRLLFSYKGNYGRLLVLAGACPTAGLRLWPPEGRCVLAQG